MERIEILEMLVEELIKPTPDDRLVREYMSQVGLTYSDDPVERINRVLQALHPSEQKEVNNGEKQPRL